MLTDKIINIFSKKNMIKFLSKVDKLENTVLISILDPDDNKPIFKKLLDKIDDYIIVKFWDVEEEVTNSEYKPIDRETARKLAEFIYKHRDKKFLIHCAAGVSRSAGVGLAVECITKHFGNKFEFGLSGCPAIIGNPRFSPNWFVYDKIIEEFTLLKEKDLP